MRLESLEKTLMGIFIYLICDIDIDSDNYLAVFVKKMWKKMFPTIKIIQNKEKKKKKASH